MPMQFLVAIAKIYAKMRNDVQVNLFVGRGLIVPEA
jgi:hypothetical protein